MLDDRNMIKVLGRKLNETGLCEEDFKRLDMAKAFLRSPRLSRLMDTKEGKAMLIAELTDSLMLDRGMSTCNKANKGFIAVTAGVSVGSFASFFMGQAPAMFILGAAAGVWAVVYTANLLWNSQEVEEAIKSTRRSLVIASKKCQLFSSRSDAEFCSIMLIGWMDALIKEMKANG